MKMDTGDVTVTFYRTQSVMAGYSFAFRKPFTSSSSCLVLSCLVLSHLRYED